MNKDLRTFLAEARQMGPEYFATVSRPVDPIYEPCVIQQKLAAQDDYPVIRFEKVNGSELPLVTNLFGKYELLGLALGVRSRPAQIRDPRPLPRARRQAGADQGGFNARTRRSSR